MLTKDEILKIVGWIVEKDYSWEKKIKLDKTNSIPKEINFIKISTDKRKNFLVTFPFKIFVWGFFWSGYYVDWKENFLKTFWNSEYDKLVQCISDYTNQK